jgi:predicted DNA-binding transcriptional regulator YafY
MNRIDRLLGILLEFQARGELRGEDLARRFEVSVRTIYRDVQALSEMGVPVVATPGTGYRLLEGYFLPPLRFTPAEAALLAIGAGMVRARLDPELQTAVDRASAKLRGVLPPEQQAAVDRWQQQLLFPAVGQPQDDAPLLTRLRQAVQDERVVRLLYHAREHGRPELREVEPISLVHISGAWYLAGWCRLRRGSRLFRLSRVAQCEVLSETFERDGRHQVGPREDDRAVYPEARIRFDPSIERFVRERQPFPFLREEADAAGRPIFVYALRGRRELLGWLLGWGDAAEVLAPPELRAALARQGRAIAARNAGAAGATGVSASDFGQDAAVVAAPDTGLSRAIV